MAPARLRFSLPPSLGMEATRANAQRLAGYLTRQLRLLVDVTVALTYDALRLDVSAGLSDAAWAPPMICARLEQDGHRVLVRGIRKGQASYRSALLCRKADALTLATLAGKSAAWTDADSVSGYLLPIAHLRSQKVNPTSLGAQRFVGSFRAGLEAVRDSRADITAIFAPAGGGPAAALESADQVLSGSSALLGVVALTGEVPNDGVVMNKASPQESIAAVQHALVGMQHDTEGRQLLSSVFNLNGYQIAQPGAYRTLSAAFVR